MFDGKAAAAEVLTKINATIECANARTREQLEAHTQKQIEARLKDIPAGPPGPKGETGPAPDPETVQAVITAQLSAIKGDLDGQIKAIPAGPQGDKGDRGDQGPAPDPEVVHAAVEAEFKGLADEFIKGLSDD